MKIDLSILHDWTLAVIGGVGTFGWWLDRLVFTNNKRIELLEQDSKHARELREKQDDAIQEIRKDQKTIIGHILKSR